MEDTQKSQPISTENREIAEQSAHEPVQKANVPPTKDGPPLLVPESSLVRLVALAKSNPNLVFTSLAHRIDLHLLRKSFKQVRKSKAAGVDKVTAKEYAVDLDENLYNLYQRLRRGQYVAQR